MIYVNNAKIINRKIWMLNFTLGDKYGGLRSVLHIKLSKNSVWSYMGTVSAGHTYSHVALTPTTIPMVIATAKPTSKPADVTITDVNRNSGYINDDKGDKLKDL